MSQAFVLSNFHPQHYLLESLGKLNAYTCLKPARKFPWSIRDTSVATGLGSVGHGVCRPCGLFWLSKDLFSDLLWNLNISPVFLFMWLYTFSLEFLCSLMYTPGKGPSKKMAAILSKARNWVCGLQSWNYHKRELFSQMAVTFFGGLEGDISLKTTAIINSSLKQS